MTKSEKKEYMKQYRRSKKGVIIQMYGHQRGNSKKRSHAMPTYTKEWLANWLLSKPKFHRLYDMWVLSGYEKAFKPSVDRKDDSIGYTEYNIQLMTWQENKQKGHDDTRSGKLKHGNKPQKAVLQFTKDGEFIAEYVSANEASRQTGVGQGNISECCGDRLKSTRKFIWKFKDEI